MRLSILIEGLSMATHPTSVTFQKLRTAIKETGFLAEFTPTAK